MAMVLNSSQLQYTKIAHRTSKQIGRLTEILFYFFVLHLWSDEQKTYSCAP